MSRQPQHGEIAFVLDLDPELGSRIPSEQREDARGAARGRIVVVPPGPCELSRFMMDSSRLVGFLIADGLVRSEVTLSDRHLIEFLGPGDILQLSEADDPPRLAGAPAIVVLDRVVLVALGATFLRAAARWPELFMAVLARIQRQRARLATQALIVHLPQARDRLLLVLWHLSSCWGRVTPDGVQLPLKLTHDLLGQLIAARRPTVSLAIKELVGEGCVERREDGSWVITEHGQQLAELVVSASWTDPERSRQPAGHDVP